MNSSRIASRVVRTALLVATTAAVSTACGDSLGPTPDAITTLPRSLSVSEQQVIAASNTFGLALMRHTVAGDTRPNVVLSPLSASMALGMTLNGADGATFDAMRNTLGFAGMSQDEINVAYSGLIELLGDLDPAVRFEIANSLWANKDFPIHPAFVAAVTAAFQATAESRDFADPATVGAINSWVKANTHGLIESIVDSLDPDMIMVLINAIFFDGAWTSRFDPEKTVSQPFTRADGSTVNVDMMQLTDAELSVGARNDYVSVELPYGGKAFSMVVVVPHTMSARDFMAGLDQAAWDEVIDGLRPSTLDLLSLPRFTLSYDGFLNAPLDTMGMGVAFRPGADFTKMSPLGDQVCIDFVRQKSFIEVNERGTRAAAVTAVGVRPTSFNAMVVDRPFVFAIRERLSGTVLFMGLVGDPTAEAEEPEPLSSTCG